VMASKEEEAAQAKAAAEAAVRKAEESERIAALEEKLAKDESSDEEEAQMTLPPGVELSEREMKLFKLRQRMSKSRKANHQAVVGEAKSRMDEAQGKKRERDYDKRSEKFKDKTAEVLDDAALQSCTDFKVLSQQARLRGIVVAERASIQDLIKECVGKPVVQSNALLQITAGEAEEENERNEKKRNRKAGWGWEAFNQDSLYKAYDKRCEAVQASDADVAKQKAALGDGYYNAGAALNYGQNMEVSEEAMNRMVSELTDKNYRNKSYSRRRAFNEEADVDYINKRNAHFNKKVERAYGEFTKEIKLNLERGTAL